MYNINKKLNAVGNININDEELSEQRSQYLIVVSCESDETDPNNGECKYTIEINNEKDEIQLIPEKVFATSIINPDNYFSIRLNDYKSIQYLKIFFTVLIGNAEMYIYSDSQHQKELQDFDDFRFSYVHRKEIIEINSYLKANYYLVIKCSEPAFIQLKYETDTNYKGYYDLIPNEINIEPIIQDINSYYNLYNPNYYFPFEKETRNNDFYYKLMAMDCSMVWSDVSQSHSNITEYNFEMEKNKLYYYLTTYGFYSKVDHFHHTSFKKENCGLIIYNGEKSENRALLVISDMPHTSKFIDTSYIYPIIYDENNDQGILIEFKLLGEDLVSENAFYQVTYFISGDPSMEIEYIYNYYTTIYINKNFYGDYLKENIFGILNVQIKKIYPDKNYYISTNFMSSKISPEYIYSNKEHYFSLRPSSSKYFYSQINDISEGYLQFSFPENEEVKVYARIVKKNHHEENYNWNKRVKLPEEGDSDLLEMKNGLIEYTKSNTRDCINGCELYFHIKSVKINADIKSTEENLIPITFSFYTEKYEDAIEINTEKTIELQAGKYMSYKLKYNEEDLKNGKILIIFTTPNDYLKPGFIYISTGQTPDFKNREYASTQIGINHIFLDKSIIENGNTLYISVSSLEDTTVKLKASLKNEINLEEYKGIRPKLKLTDISNTNLISFTYKKTEYINKKKILIYSLAENINYFNMKVEFIYQKGIRRKTFDVIQRFENGYGAIIDFTLSVFDEEDTPKIDIIITSIDDKYLNRKIEIGYEIIDDDNNEKREVNILEHIYGMTEKLETCYKVKGKDISELNKSIMLINIFSQSLEFNIKDSNNNKIYSLDVFNNYFIRIPNITGDYFCFKHTTPKDSDDEVYGEISYDFQIYNEDELSKYQIFIIPLINGKIYTHSLNRGDIIIYRHNYYGNYTQENEKNIYSANMLRIRGNPNYMDLLVMNIQIIVV